MNTTIRRAVLPGLLAITLALPFLLRPKDRAAAKADEVLVVISPHNEAIRHEFARAFTQWYRQRTGRTVAFDWRLIGGTSEIARYLEGEYSAGFQYYWEKKLGRTWNDEIAAGFTNGRLPDDAPAAVKEARAAFLASAVGCSIDVFFGGGAYDFVQQARAGRLVDSGVVKNHPEWFNDAVIPRTFAGEEFWDADGRWVGTVLSSFGVIVNHDALKRLGIAATPAEWTDLKDPRYRGQVALADPTKSGSINKAFENVIQQQMQRQVRARVELARFADEAARKAAEAKAVADGWTEGLRLLQLIAANGRYFTDSAQKVPIDVAAGDCAVGMCIDFYGRQQQEALVRRGGGARVSYLNMRGGSVASVDPVGVLRGAPNRAAAEAFVEFCVSMEGQKLWNLRTGIESGPVQFALRRPPVRRDFYDLPGVAALRSDAEELPFAEDENRLIYRSEWTGRLFRELAFVIRVMCLDTHPELKEAWKEIIAAGMPGDALAVLQDVSAVDYALASGRIKAALLSKNKTEEIKLAAELGEHFRAQYVRAAELARAARKASAKR